MILEEFDETINSTFDPYEVENVIEGFPKLGVSCFSKKLFDQLVDKFKGIEIALSSNGNGKLPIYKIIYEGHEIALFMSRVGAPACVVQYEELFAMGLEKIVVFGTCGVLDKNIDDLAIIIPNAAIRDEGTSYHYLKSSREVVVNSKYKEEFVKLLKEHAYSYIIGKVWTTDAPYRETRKKVIDRKEEGCVCVDMECSAISALAKFRNKEVFQFFYAADNLDSAKWDKRSLGNTEKLSDKEKIGLLAIKFAIIID
ncbi:MAG: nucleoside phosphorylase [Bacilli bacterium]|nr:nucleoside phosphorylase [Bacilli bacterium]